MASASTDVAGWTTWIEQHRLYDQDGWRKIMYYEPAWGGWRSQAEDPAFFFSPHGSSDPRAEMIASVNAFLDDSALMADEAAQCRFPRRFDWIREQLPASMHWPDVQCRALSDFIDQAAPAGLTLIYPTSYLNNPASMFGHTFVRVDARESGRRRNDLLALTISYGADVSPNENGFVYAFKGLAGLYPGSVRSHPYYRQVQNYNELESRDIWEYPLNVTPDQAEDFIKAGWDLKGINFNYAYLLKNCSYRLLSVMEAAFPEYDLVQSFDVYAVPIDTLRVLRRDDLLGAPRYRPAIASRIQYLADRLSPTDYRLSRALVDRGVADDRARRLDALPVDEQRRVVDLAYEYSRFKAKRSDVDLAEVSYDLLRLRARQPSGEVDIDAADWPADPLVGHGVRRLGLGASIESGHPALRLSARPAYHDSYDRQAGFLPDAQINALQTELRVTPEDGRVDVALDRFDLVDFRSFSPYSPMMPALAWTGRLGWSRGAPDDADLPFRAALGLGRAWRLGRRGLGFALATTEVTGQADLYLGTHLGWIGTLGDVDRLGVEADVGRRRLSDRLDATARLVYNHAWGPNRAVRCRLSLTQRDGDPHLGASVEWYRYF